MRRRSRAILGSLLALASAVEASIPPVKVTLRSSWPAPPVLLEIIETVSLENPDAFFAFVDRVTDPDVLPPVAQTLTPEATHQFALQVAASNGYLSEPGSIAAVEMNLGLHAATPKIEAFYNYYTARNAQDLGCGSWVDWYGEVVCDVETLRQLAGVETIDPANSTDIPPPEPILRPKTLTFDHILPSPAKTLERPPRTAILYASLDSPNFRDLHSYLYSLADSDKASIEYIFRHVPPKTTAQPNYLSGYGVSLDLKKMDYLAVDDRNAGSSRARSTSETTAGSEETPEVDPILALIQAYPEPESTNTPGTPLSEEAIALLGFQATQLIADSLDPLTTLSLLSQNFPKYMPLLSRVTVNSSVQEEIHANQLKAQAGVNMLWLNGAPVAEKDVHPLSLLSLVRTERKVMQSLVGLGLGSGQAMELVTDLGVSKAQTEAGALDGVFDASDREEGQGAIVWLNDIEKDSRYAQWSTSLHSILRPLYPGQFHQVKLNLFNVVLVLDLSNPSSLSTITGVVANIISRGFPFRFGIVPLTQNEDALKMARLFYHSVKNYGRKRTMSFLKAASTAFVTAPDAATGMDVLRLDWPVIKAAFTAEVLEGTPASPDVPVRTFEQIVNGIGEDPEPQADKEADKDGGEASEGQEEKSPAASVVVSVETSIERGKRYVERLSASGSGGGGCGFVNGKYIEMDDNFWRSMQGEISQHLQHYQAALYGGKISDDDTSNISNYFYDLPTSSIRRNRYIFPPSPDDLRIVSLPEVFGRTGFRVGAARFVYPPETELIPMTVYVVADFDSEGGLALLKEALLSIDEGGKTRLSFMHNPSLGSDTTVRQPVSWLLSHLLGRNLLSKASAPRLLRALGLDEAAPVASGDGSHTQIPLPQDDDLTDGVGISGYSAEDYDSWLRSSRLVARELQLAPGQQALVINGRVVGPIAAWDFKAMDFKTLESYELNRRTEPVVQALENVKPDFTQADRASSANLISMTSSVLAALYAPDVNGGGIFDSPKRPRQRNYQMLDDTYSTFQFGDNSTALYHIAVLIDPVSEIAQKWSSLLEWLSHIPDVYIKVYTNPMTHQEIPLKRFYRYALLPSPIFDDAGNEVSTQAVFEDLPIEPIYTLGMDVPTSWLVRPREALYDLDNIQLGSLSAEDSSLEAVFALDYIVVEGHARDSLTNAPPRGVQLQLLDGDSSPVDDTQVVANLGYLQFKAKPGVFQLEIREGRGRDIFTMDSVGNEGLDSRTVAEVGNEITVTSFEGLTIYPRLSRNPGMDEEDVLADPEDDDEDEPSGIIGDLTARVKSIFGFKESPSPPTTTAMEPVSGSGQADINIFTVASGLLYERFVSIMILSVLRNTNSTVKFWFIENFLSPSFLEFIPHLAKAYNFQYELVTYKWPSWLRAQKEKQRVIWAYKILFLDVLFPMDLKKVIFVDADQIVRADLKELVDLDLHGAPYGYTPMGDDNTDMEGFRFWKTGYWKDFLQGRPYHISALYVIDLVRFRKLAAGDILRGSYQQLSADPNSLANLDQDLPNNLQREVPIFSLHEDWLWCETWCSKDRLHRAKTIDLCQNPLTKEPKLARARQIPEWEEYDSEISRFARKLAEDGVIRSQIVAADANALAASGSGGVQTKVEDPVEVEGSTVQELEAPRDEL